jgi:hypothetical protein
MTALVASLGFVPMAISTSQGAELQRPFATVVIFGILTSTALTLLIIPLFLAGGEELGPEKGPGQSFSTVRCYPKTWTAVPELKEDKTVETLRSGPGTEA